jgi:hypothetical protein
MRKSNRAVLDPDLRAEYDFSTMAGGVRGKYLERYRAGVNLVLLEPEVAKAFPTAEAVNQALRTAMRAAKALRRQHVLPNKQMQRTRPAQAKKPRR